MQEGKPCPCEELDVPLQSVDVETATGEKEQGFLPSDSSSSKLLLQGLVGCLPSS